MMNDALGFCSFPSLQPPKSNPPPNSRNKNKKETRGRSRSGSLAKFRIFFNFFLGFCFVFLAPRLLYVWCSFHLVWYYFVSLFLFFCVCCKGKEEILGFEARLRECRLNTSWTLFKSNRKEKTVSSIKGSRFTITDQSRITKGVQAFQIESERKQQMIHDSNSFDS